MSNVISKGLLGRVTCYDIWHMAWGMNAKKLNRNVKEIEGMKAGGCDEGVREV